MKNTLLICLCLLGWEPIYPQYFQKLGDGMSVHTFSHPQGINYYIHETDPSGVVYAVYYDTVTLSSDPGKEYSQIRLQVYDGISWLFSKPVRLYSRYSTSAPRVLDIRYHQGDIYVCGSFDSSQNNYGAGIIRFSNRAWSSCNANLFQSNPDYFEVNKMYSFRDQLMITGNFDSVPGIRVNGLLLWSGSAWHPVGSAGKYGFGNTSGTSNVFFSVVNDSLYAYNKNKITPDSIEIGGLTTKKLAVFRNGQFAQLLAPAQYIAQLASYKQRLVIIPSSQLVYINSFMIYDAGAWKTFYLQDSFYATNLTATTSFGNSLYLLFQDINTKMIHTYAFNGIQVSKRTAFKIADAYLALESRSRDKEISLAGNFHLIRKGEYSDSMGRICKLVFEPRTVYTGTTYLDLNGDHARQVSEPALPYCKVYSANHSYMSMSDGSGKVNMLLPVNGNYTLKGLNDKGYVCNENIAISSSADSIYTGDLGFTYSGTNDVGVKMISHTANKAKLNFRTTYTVKLSNYSSAAKSIQLKITVPRKCSDFKFQSPLVKTADGFLVNTSVPAQDQQSFSFSCIYSPDSFSAGEKVFASASIHLQDADQENNSDSVRQTVAAAFEPNVKIASTQVVVNKKKVINYHIFFQNLGDDTAYNVTVLDTIGKGLDLVKAVYNNTGPIHIRPQIENNVFIWRFRNINLPPAQYNDSESIGFVNFSIFLDQDSKIGDTIFNKAYIYFDYRKPVITNKAGVTFENYPSGPGLESVNDFDFFPNPCRGIFQYVNTGQLEGELLVYSVDGKIVYSTPMRDKGYIILPETLSNGVYMLKCSGSDLELGKIIVTR